MKKIRRRNNRSNLASSVKRDILSREKKKREAPVEFLHSGAHILNLALSGKGRHGGWARGRVNNIVGDGSSGKTICALELCYWCCKQVKKIRSKIFPRVKKVIIVYNNCEGVMDFPMEKMWGKDFAEAIEWVCIKDIQESGRDFIRRLDNLKKGEFLLYVIDSWDSMLSPEEIKRFQKSVKDDKDLEGSYNAEIYKYIGRFFAYTSGIMDNNKKDATLMIVSQVRYNIGVKFGKKYKRTGGKALDFYTHMVAYIAVVNKLSKIRKKRKLTYGIESKIRVDRSKVAKPFREADFTILFDFGIDDIDSMLQFLYGNSTNIRFDGKRFANRKDLILYVQNDKKHFDHLVDLIEEEWNNAEDDLEEEELGERTKLY